LVPQAEISAYGAVKGELVPDAHGIEIYRIDDLVEKPQPEMAPSNLAIIGRYILTPDIFGCLEEAVPGTGGEIQLTNALRSQLKARPIYGVCFEGTRYDAGSKLGFLKATVEFALCRNVAIPDKSSRTNMSGTFRRVAGYPLKAAAMTATAHVRQGVYNRPMF